MAVHSPPPNADKSVDPHLFFQGRAGLRDDLGRRQGDAEKLFPKYTHASAATTGEVAVNGKIMKLWTYSQLEPLNTSALRQRASTIRDTVGEANCPPMPSGQQHDLLRWILFMQSHVTKQVAAAGRMGGYGGEADQLVPTTLVDENAQRPIDPRPPPSAHQPSARAGANLPVTRDHINELSERTQDAGYPLGIESLKPGGEGKKHLFPRNNMDSSGMSTVGPVSIASLKEAGEGRRYIRPDDHIMHQRQELQALQRGEEIAAIPYRKAGGGLSPHVSDSNLKGSCGLTGEDAKQLPVAGDRRRHLDQPDHMVGPRQCSGGEQTQSGKKHLDCFAGAKSFSNYKASEENYQSTWKQNPSKLRGSSMII